MFKKLRGVVVDAVSKLFQIGIDGPQIKAESGSEMQIRNNDDTGFARVKVGAPVDDQDAVTKFYADTLSKPIIVSRQADTSSALPTNTAQRGFVVVTTAGTGAVIGDLLYDDGSGSGDMQILAAVEGRTIAVTDSLTGGTISFEPDSIYIWDADGGSWIKVGDVGNTTGAKRVVRYNIDNTADQDSTFEIPANAIIHECIVKITTSYSGGATIEVGRASDTDLIMLASDNKAQAPAGRLFSVEQDTEWGVSADAVKTTITGAPAAGAGVVIVFFSIPNG